ncbi:nuclease [Rhynchospora pubera]|uniref:Nuclease n=1 Tax=Rhynchospora pubera TaxID=906938 RepID=A0AAV8GVH3_9POAL|nr:nuclease [Rhynchospora pubera]
MCWCHIRVKVPRDEVKRYRSRKKFPTHNNLVACTFDLKFTYVLAGWEGSAHDSKVLQDALSREDRLLIPRGRYYLADAGYALTPSFITPYRGVRYHLKEYSIHPPENERELFNLRHSSLRNAVERSIGILKKKFPIIASGSEPYYDEETVSDLFLACCIIHNYLMGVDPDEELIAQVDEEIMHSEIESNTLSSSSSRNDNYRLGEQIRDDIALKMWHDYNLNAS